MYNIDDWNDLEFEVAFNSVAVVHVCGPGDCPRCSLEESPGSRRGQEFLMGDGGTIPNLGQKRLNLFDEPISKPIASVSQIAAVTRPLMSVGRVCDEGHNVTFDVEKVVVRSSAGDELRRFVRTAGGFYVAKLKLKNPMVSPGRNEQWDSGPCEVLKTIIFVYE